MARPSKKKQIPHLQEAIKDTAWNQIAQFGAPALSLRAIARGLKITAPAIYNYFPDRDALVTALIIDAYTSFGDSQLTARDQVPADHHAARLMSIGLAYRQWAHTHPERYQLLFGTPIPGYVKPLAQIFPSAARSISALFSVVEEIRAAGYLNATTFLPIQKAYEATFEMWKTQIGDVHPTTHFVAMIIWARVHGLVSLEIQGNLPPFGETGDALYRLEINTLIQQFILT